MYKPESFAGRDTSTVGLRGRELRRCDHIHALQFRAHSSGVAGDARMAARATLRLWEMSDMVEALEEWAPRLRRRQREIRDG